MLNGLGNFAGLNRLFNGSSGMQANRMLDALGLPDSLGDMIGAQIDLASGDMAGFARNMMDLTSGLKSGQLDGLFGKGLVGPHFMPAPKFGLGRGKKLWSHTFHTPFGSHQISRERLGGRGFMGRMVGRSMERAIMRNPAFKAQMEAKLGGRIILDGRADGKITVDRYRPNFTAIPLAANLAANAMLKGIYGGLARMEANLKRLAGGMLQGGTAKSSGSFGVKGSGTGILKDPDTAKLAKGMGMQQPLSFEDLLFLMMMKYAKKKEKEILGKMNELAKSKGSGTGDASKGQMFTEGSGVDGKGSDTTKQMQLQKLMEDLKKMYEMLSNVMKSMNSMQMAAVRNLPR